MSEQQLDYETLKFATKGLSYLGHPIRLRILEYLDVNGSSSVSTIAKGIDEEQLFVSQSLKKLRDAELVVTHRKGIFIYYNLSGEYPASVFKCIRKLFAVVSNQYEFIEDGYKKILPHEFTNLAANQIKLFTHIDKMRILEFLIINGRSCVSDIVNATGIEQVKISQYLKKMRDDAFVKSCREGKFVFYEITKGVHKTAIQCTRKKFMQE